MRMASWQGWGVPKTPGVLRRGEGGQVGNQFVPQTDGLQEKTVRRLSEHSA